MVVDFSFARFKETNVCQLVVEVLKKAVAAWQVAGAEWRALPGCFISVLLAYVEMLDEPMLNPIDKRIPHALYYDPKKLMELCRNDLIKKGTRDPRTWILGKLPWKSPNDVLFADEGSIVLPANVRLHKHKRHHSSFVDVPPSPKQFKSVPSSSASVDAEARSGDMFAKTFEDLYAALSRAVDLSLLVPITTSRLAFISGILPAGEVFDEDAHRIKLNAEFGNLEQLQKTISQLLVGFSTYRKTRDNSCKPFEDRATEYLSQIFRKILLLHLIQGVRWLMTIPLIYLSL